METEADHVKLQLLQAPHRGQDGSTEGHSQRELDWRGSITQVCGTTREGAGVASTQDGASQRVPTQVWVQAAADVQGDRSRCIELWEDWKQNI